MKSALTIFLIISFVGVAVFGFTSMIFGVEQGMGCIASTLGGSAFCQHGAINFVIFHLDFFKFFSTAVLIIILIALLAGIVFSILPPALDDEEESDIFFSGIILRSSNHLKNQLIHWLAIHINSPVFIAAAK